MGFEAKRWPKQPPHGPAVPVGVSSQGASTIQDSCPLLAYGALAGGGGDRG